jgi:polysaccharide biosynthesis/export protein
MGMTTFEFARQIEDRYRKSFLQDPQVIVRIVTSFGQQVTVEGSIEKPGIYPIRGSTTLLQAVALAGGLKDGADPRRVVVFRTIDGKRKGAAFDLQSIRTGASEDPTVFGNDIIVVDGSQTSQTWREILRTLPVLGVFVSLF